MLLNSITMNLKGVVSSSYPCFYNGKCIKSSIFDPPPPPLGEPLKLHWFHQQLGSVILSFQILLVACAVGGDITLRTCNRRKQLAEAKGKATSYK
jgi:hypothetical protein